MINLFNVEVFGEKNTPTDKHDANFINETGYLKSIYITK